jgi:hypothetical protein
MFPTRSVPNLVRRLVNAVANHGTWALASLDGNGRCEVVPAVLVRGGGGRRCAG